MFRPLDDRVLVAGQIRPDQIAEAAVLGVTTIVNNRPDGEEAGQPTAAEIEAAAKAAGLAYRSIPISGGFGPDQIAEMAEAMEAAEGKLLAFCRSGTRSTFLWALARHRLGGDGPTIFRQAEAAGYDLSPLRPYLG